MALSRFQKWCRNFALNPFKICRVKTLGTSYRDVRYSSILEGTQAKIIYPEKRLPYIAVFLPPDMVRQAQRICLSSGSSSLILHRKANWSAASKTSGCASRTMKK